MGEYGKCKKCGSELVLKEVTKVGETEYEMVYCDTCKVTRAQAR